MPSPKRSLRLSLLALTLAVCGQVEARSDAQPESPLSRGPFERQLLLTGELEAVRSISIKAPQTTLFQMRIQFMAEEGSQVAKGEPLLNFDSSALVDKVRQLETQILDAETQIVSKQSELRSSLKDLEIELAEREYGERSARLEASVDRAILSDKEYGERQLTLSKAERELAETHERIRLTRERGQADLDVLQINRDRLQQDLLAAQEGLDLLAIEAPSDGLVVYETRPRSTLRWQEGDSCWPGQEVMQLPDLSEMQILFWVSEVDAPLLKTGMRVDVSLDAFPGRSLGGSITHIPSMAVKRDDDSRLSVFKVTASLDQTWQGEMKPGMSVRGRVLVESREQAPLLARGSTEVDADGYWLRLGEGERMRRERFQPSARNARHYLLEEAEWERLATLLGRGGK